MKTFIFCVIVLSFVNAVCADDKAEKTNREIPKWAIGATSSIRDRESNLLTFSGNVSATKGHYTITCDKLLFYLDDKNELKEFVATGQTVTVMLTVNGKLMIAKGRKVKHLAKDKATVITGGPPYLQAGDQYVNTDCEDSKIILEDNGKYKVQSPTRNGTRIVIPIRHSWKFMKDPAVNLDSRP